MARISLFIASLAIIYALTNPDEIYGANFVPTISIGEITAHSIAIKWSMPTPQLQNRVQRYKVLATHQDNEIETNYVDKNLNSYVFRNLASQTDYLLEVAACSNSIVRCGYWSAPSVVSTLHEEKEPQGMIWQNVMIIVVVLFVIVVFVWMGIRKHREMAARKKSREETLNRYDDMALECLDPELNLGDQAQRIPYDDKWEFPRKLLILDKVLGSGAFGIVRKAHVKSIRKGDPLTTVTVKMARASANLNHMTALNRELKILSYLGIHLNIVNLLGACTKHVSYGELFVVVEFCRYGNLRDYLFHRRADFVHNLQDPSTRNIGAASNSSTDRVNGNHYGVEPGTRDSCGGADSSDKGAVVNDGLPLTDSAAPTWPSKYGGDYTDDDVDPICTRDLLCWAWQVACGMKYLGSRRVLHGDLAARNILLADHNVVKISDFGLSKALYMEESQKKNAYDHMPVKWMAIESIRDRVFSVYSDIWSYGIVLWEFFTLAETPYDGIHPKNICQKLIDGFRMIRPKHASEDMYNLMLHCWDADPLKRPSFDKLENSIARSLDESGETHYYQLNAAYF